MFGLKCLLNYSGIRGTSNRHLIRHGNYRSDMVFDRVLPTTVVIRMPLTISRSHGKAEIFKKAFLYYRYSDDNSVDSGASDGHIRPGLCDECPAWPAVLPDPADGADGPARWHVEAARERRLCSQTRINYNVVHRILGPYFCLVFSVFDGEGCG